MARPLVAQIDNAALAANLARVRALAAGARVLAVVKADAYGHRLARVLPALAAADGLALVELDTAVRLRERGERRPVLLLEGFFAPDELETFAAHSLASVVHCAEQVDMLEKARLSRPLDVYLKLNTGMNRLGIAPADARALAQRLSQAQGVASLCLMTHFARADEPDAIAEPLARFNAACEGLPYPRSLANSAGVVRYADVGGDIVRPGVMLYGATPFGTRSARALGLSPVMTLRSKLIGVQTLGAGDSVGYAATNVGTGPFRLAPRVGDRLAISIYYDQRGHIFFTVTDLTRPATQTMVLYVGRLIYSAASLWVQTDRVRSVVPPAADTRLGQFTRSRLTTYSGDHGTIAGPWTTSKMITTTTGTASGTVIVSPSGLSSGGRNFAAWLRHR